jgi:glycosyltransferase involved in cell wall biosynthesis
MINVDGKPPKISCLMVTANGRFETFIRAARCYADQTYPNRELVVVNEGTKEYQRQIAEHLAGRDDVRLIFLDGKYTLGGLRNIAIRLCQGPLFCQWDDDDFNSPERLALQALVEESQKNVSGTVRLKLYKGNLIAAGRKSPVSLYNPQIATMEADPTKAYNQNDATGFIRLNGLRLKTAAIREASAVKAHEIGDDAARALGWAQRNERKAAPRPKAKPTSLNDPDDSEVPF